jgi:hypothetical protein
MSGGDAAADKYCGGVQRGCLGKLPDIFRPADVNEHRETGHVNYNVRRRALQIPALFSTNNTHYFVICRQQIPGFEKQLVQASPYHAMSDFGEERT